jgi:MtN3 and saliva related transmembrane protein
VAYLCGTEECLIRFMDIVKIIGLLAGILTTISFLPQVIQTWKTKSAKDLSLPMFLIFFLGTILWLIYGIMIDSLPVTIANAVTMVLAFILLIFKLIFKE